MKPDLEAIRKRQLKTFAGRELISQSAADAHELLAYVDELREAAGRVTCWRCSGTGLGLDGTQRGHRFIRNECPDCADLRRLLGEKT